MLLTTTTFRPKRNLYAKWSMKLNRFKYNEGHSKFPYECSFVSSQHGEKN